MNSPRMTRRSPVEPSLPPGQIGHPISIGRKELRDHRMWLNLGCALVACIATAWVNPYSLIGYVYYLALWTLFMFAFDRKELPDFLTAFFVNALLTAAFVVVQIHSFPDSYGMTSPHGSQTDDSYFFSLIADETPSDIETREAYDEYRSGFSDIIRYLTPFRVVHPLDVLYFLSGISGLLAVYTRQFANRLTGDVAIGRSAYVLCLICPLLLMSGGAILVRDTFVAAILMLSLCCINRRRLLAFAGCIFLQFYLRPGTALIILPLYGVIYAHDVIHWVQDPKSRKRTLFLLLLMACGTGVFYALRDQVLALLEDNSIMLPEFSREGMIDNYLDTGGRSAFLWIQFQPLPVKLLLAPVYMLVNPFFNLDGMLTFSHFDARIFLIGFAYPIFAFFIHAWVLGGLVSRHAASAHCRWLMAALLLGYFMIGVYSLESRHKTILQPLYYVLAAVGWRWASFNAKTVGFFISSLWLLAQIVFYLH